MFGSLGNIAELFKSARQLQERMAKLQESLAQLRFEATAGGDMVRAVVDGRSTLVSVKIDPKAAADIELLEDLITAAVNSATAKAQEAMKSEMSAMTGGLNLPDMAQMLGGGGAT
jgi:hypothetical protein